jgi:hypothetical protein
MKPDFASVKMIDFWQGLLFQPKCRFSIISVKHTEKMFSTCTLTGGGSNYSATTEASSFEAWRRGNRRYLIGANEGQLRKMQFVSESKQTLKAEYA